MCIELEGENDDEEEHGWEDELCSHYDQESQLVAELRARAQYDNKVRNVSCTVVSLILYLHGIVKYRKEATILKG